MTNGPDLARSGPSIVGSPERIRTAVSALRGPRARPLHYGAMKLSMTVEFGLENLLRLSPDSFPNRAGKL